MSDEWGPLGPLAGEYDAVTRLVESLPDKHGSTKGYYLDE